MVRRLIRYGVWYSATTQFVSTTALHLRQGFCTLVLFIFLWKSDCLGCAVLLCLVVCLTLLASFFLHSASCVCVCVCVFSNPCKVVYKYMEDGSKVRVSKRSGCVLPKPPTLTDRKTSVSQWIYWYSTTDNTVATTQFEFTCLSGSVAQDSTSHTLACTSVGFALT